MIPVWGYAGSPGALVDVTLTDGTPHDVAVVTAVARNDRSWKVYLPPITAGPEPFTVKASTWATAAADT